MIRILHTADWHLQNSEIKEIEKCLKFIVEKAQKERLDLIIIAGDLFNSRDIRLDSKSSKIAFQAVSELADIAPVAVVIGTPSHDGQAAEVLRHIKAKHNVWVSTIPEQLFLYEKLSGKYLCKEDGHFVRAVISMIPAPTKQFFETQSDIKGADSEIAQAMSAIFAGFGAEASRYDCPHILVGHWNTTGSLVSETQILTGVDVEISKDHMALANADLVCLGHIHYHQQIGANIFYSGSIYRKDFGELDEKGVYVHEISSNGSIQSVFETTPTRKLLKVEVDLTIEGSHDNLDTTLNSLENLHDSFIRCEFKVYQDEAGKLDQKQIKEFFLSAGVKDVDVRLIRVPRENVRSENILKLQTLREKLIEQARLKNETVPEPILAKADLLETETHERILTQVASN